MDVGAPGVVPLRPAALVGRRTGLGRLRDGPRFRDAHDGRAIRERLARRRRRTAQRAQDRHGAADIAGRGRAFRPHRFPRAGPRRQPLVRRSFPADLGRVSRCGSRAPLRRRGLPHVPVELLRGRHLDQRRAAQHGLRVLLLRVPVLRDARAVAGRGGFHPLRDPGDRVLGQWSLSPSDRSDSMRGAGQARTRVALRCRIPRPVGPLLLGIQEPCRPSVPDAGVVQPISDRAAFPDRDRRHHSGTLGADPGGALDPRCPRVALPQRCLEGASHGHALDRLRARVRSRRRRGEGRLRRVPCVALRDLFHVSPGARFSRRVRGDASVEPPEDSVRDRRGRRGLLRHLMDELARCAPLFTQRSPPRQGGAGRAGPVARAVFRHVLPQPRGVRSNPSRGRIARALCPERTAGLPFIAAIDGRHCRVHAHRGVHR